MHLQAICCLLFRFRGRDLEVHAVPAGFLAGAAFLFEPRLSTLTAVLTTTIQQLTKSITADSAVHFPRLLTSVPLAVFYGVLLHCRTVDKDLCNPFFDSFVTVISGGR
jgi:hypothetical protein